MQVYHYQTGKSCKQIPVRTVCAKKILIVPRLLGDRFERVEK